MRGLEGDVGACGIELSARVWIAVVGQVCGLVPLDGLFLMSQKLREMKQSAAIELEEHRISTVIL